MVLEFLAGNASSPYAEVLTPMESILRIECLAQYSAVSLRPDK